MRNITYDDTVKTTKKLFLTPKLQDNRFPPLEGQNIAVISTQIANTVS